MRTRVLWWLLLLPLALVSAGCGGGGGDSSKLPPNPVATAQTIDQKAYALGELFAIVKGEAVQLVQKPGTPREVVKAVRDADRLASPVVRTMMIAAREYSKISGEIEQVKEAGGSPTAQILAALATALSRVQQTYADAKPAADRFIASVRTAKGA